jgi:hypothetical protein
MLISWSGSAGSQELERNDFNIDAVTGPVLGSSRVVGMGGAYTALATDIDGAHWNPASFGSRPLYEFDWFEYGLSLSYFAPGLFGLDDFYNNRDGLGVDGFSFLSLGLRFQFGNFGAGGDTRVQIYNTGSGRDEVNILLVESHLGLAYALWDGQVVVGLGARVVDLDMDLPDQTQLVHFTGAGLEGGVLLKLESFPWRLGVAGRGPVNSRAQLADGMVEIDGVKTVHGFVMPNKVLMPWEVRVGFAWQFGPRPMNRRWVAPYDPEPGLRAELERARCLRAASQLLREKEGQKNVMPQENMCPDLPEQPRDPGWWMREEKLRQAEDQVLEKSLEMREESIEKEKQKEYLAIPRTYWLISADLFLEGSTEDGIGIDAFVEQERRRSGEELSVGFRIGAETEIIPDQLKLRAGFYLEPARNAGASPRPHGTGGVEVRLFRWDLFGYLDEFDLRISLTVDGAPRYLDIGVGIGFWH